MPTSVAELPLFWEAPAPEVRGPGADFGSEQIGSAPAPGKKGGSMRLRLYTLTFFSFGALKKRIINASLFWITVTVVSHVLSQQQGFPFLLAKKMQPELP